jgi:glucose/arabinose dehydrogenase
MYTFSLRLSALLLLPAVLTSCPYAPGPSSPDKGAMIRLEAVAQDLERPLFLTSPPGDASRLFIVEQGGRVMLWKDGAVLGTPFLDLSSLIGSSSGERGLLGMAFHPEYESNGIFFVNYTDGVGDTAVALYCAFADDPDRGDPDTARILLTIPQPFGNHNGGMIAFGPDGYLYIASGDGGSGNDPEDNGQNLETLLGKILRIDVDSGTPYGVPEDNPFAGASGTRGEIWAYGVRNPWRFSFDRATGDLWMGDVGQNALEEINFQSSDSSGGENYGWRNREGNLCRPGESDCSLPDAVEPLHVYSNVGSQSVTGGYVYRGASVPALAGNYFFADFVSGRVYALVREPGGNVSVTDETESLQTGGGSFSSVASFGEDGVGELYIVDYGAGVVYKVGPA